MACWFFFALLKILISKKCNFFEKVFTYCIVYFLPCFIIFFINNIRVYLQCRKSCRYNMVAFIVFFNRNWYLYSVIAYWTCFLGKSSGWTLAYLYFLSVFVCDSSVISSSSTVSHTLKYTYSFVSLWRGPYQDVPFDIIIWYIAKTITTF